MTGDEEEGRAGSEVEVVVFRCEMCGDTFPGHEGDPPRCPSCGSANAHEAHEPLL